MTWSELARLSGVNKTTLSQIKNGQKRSINSDHEIKLAKAFGIKVSELYTEKVNW